MSLTYNPLLFSVLADVVHMTCRQVKSAKDDLALAVSTLLHTEPCEGIYRSDTQSQATLTPKQVSATLTQQHSCESVL